MDPPSLAEPVKVAVRARVNYLEPARLRIPGPEVLINMVRRRVRQLIQGHRPLTETDPRMDFADIALKEIGEGKLFYELDPEVESTPESSLPHDAVTPGRI